ncbi:hypothetical protein VJV57_25320, partial [Escherichia coli]|uniref:hypothetical protein n=1 Tax=Escherichia coli TaxID=562 RepID=UPI002DBC4472
SLSSGKQVINDGVNAIAAQCAGWRGDTYWNEYCNYQAKFLKKPNLAYWTGKSAAKYEQCLTIARGDKRHAH